MNIRTLTAKNSAAKSMFAGRYREDKHFYCLDGEALKRFKDCSENLGIVAEFCHEYISGIYFYSSSMTSKGRSNFTDLESVKKMTSQRAEFKELGNLVVTTKYTG